MVVDGVALAHRCASKTFSFLTMLVNRRGAGIALVFIASYLRINPEVSRGLLALDLLDEMHHRLSDATAVDDILVCPHYDQYGCARPGGMLLEAARRAQIDLADSFVVGDRWRDIDAGRSVGCYSILIERPYSNCSTADACVPCWAAR